MLAKQYLEHIRHNDWKNARAMWDKMVMQQDVYGDIYILFEDGSYWHNYEVLTSLGHSLRSVTGWT